jgi:FkbM family methyltransferase
MDERLQLGIPCPLRKPLVLLGKSCHLHLSSLTFQNRAQQAESLDAARQSLGAAFETRDFDSLYRCTVGLVRADGTTATVTLASANSQLHGLNIDTVGFQFGYEPDIAAVIDFFVGNDGTLVDVGANFGYFSLYLASREAFCGTVYAFEPSTRGFNDLEKLVAGFDLGDRIRIHQCALGDSSGRIDMFLSNSDGLTTMVASMANRLERVVGKQTAELRKLDDFTFGQIDLIKIDVEGAEAMVIAGGLNVIKAHSPVVVFESWASVDESRAFACLLDCGYRFFVPTWGDQQGQMSTAITNAVDPTKLVLVMFQETERMRLPERVNVVAIHSERINKLSRSSVMQ